MISRLFRRWLGDLPMNLVEKVSTLAIPELENLAEAIFDFTQLEDAQAWLEQRQS